MNAEITCLIGSEQRLIQALVAGQEAKIVMTDEDFWDCCLYSLIEAYIRIAEEFDSCIAFRHLDANHTCLCFEARPKTQPCLRVIPLTLS